MILKVILLLLILYGVYRLLGGRLFSTNRKAKDLSKSDSETLIECEKCHTFVSVKDALKSSGRYYCSQECLP
jgi:uncharacterized protein